MAAWFYLTLINDETPEMTEHLTARIEMKDTARSGITWKAEEDRRIETEENATSVIEVLDKSKTILTEKTEVVWHVGRG